MSGFGKKTGRENKHRQFPKKLKWFESKLQKLNLPKSLPKGVCHCDFHFSNVLFFNGKFNALIDFDDANYTFLMFDLVSLVEPFVSSFKHYNWFGGNVTDNVFDFGEPSELYQNMKNTVV